MLKKFVFVTTCFIVFILVFQGCVYHKGDEVYPSPKDSSGNTICDTTDMQL